MNIYVICAPVSLITLVLASSSFDCRFTWVEPSNSRKNEVEGHVDQRGLQRRPKITRDRQKLRPKSKHKRSPKRSVRQATGLGQSAAATVYPWGPPRPWWWDAWSCPCHALPRVAFCCARFRFSFVWLFVFSLVFCCFALLCWWTWTFKRTQYIPFQSSILSS